MSLAYLGCLLGSLAGIAAIDWRWRVAAFAQPRRALMAVGAATAVLLAWDAAGIALGVFRIGDSPAMTGIELAPHMPLEEPIFLLFLSYLSLVAWLLALRLVRRLRQRPARDGDGERA